MAVNLTLSNGDVLTFRPDYTHRMERAFKEALTKGMQLKQKGQEVIVESIQADALDRATEAVLQLLIEKISRNGTDTPYSTEWMLDLKEGDFERLRETVASLRGANEAEKARGKKNS